MIKKIDTSGFLFNNKSLIKLIIPLLIEQFLTLAVGLADSIMVSSVGEAAVSAVSLVDTVMILIIIVFAAIAAGGAIVAGQALGQKNQEKGSEVTEQVLLISVVFSIVVMALMYAMKSFILNIVFGKIEADVMSNANKYILITTASVPFIAIYNVGAAIYRGMGDSKTPMVTSFVSNLINIAGNATLIYGFKWGIEGAATPTLIARIISGITMLILIGKKSNILHVRKYIIRPNWTRIKQILHIGIPYGLENSMFQLGKIIVISLVSTFGTPSITANAVSNNICAFAILGGMASNYALSAVAAQCVGAGDYRQVRYYTKKIISVAYISTVLMNIVIVVALPLIMRVYNLSSDTAEYARNIIIFHAICASIVWPAAFTLPSGLRAANDVTFSMIVSVISMWAFRVGCSYLLAYVFKLGVYSVWIAMIIDWIVRAIFFVARYRTDKWQRFKVNVKSNCDGQDFVNTSDDVFENDNENSAE